MFFVSLHICILLFLPPALILVYIKVAATVTALVYIYHTIFLPFYLVFVFD